jgi:hypothetical protein
MESPAGRNRSAIDRGAAGTVVLARGLAAIFAAQLFDFATFVIMVKLHGIDSELNPLVQDGFELGGFRGLFVFKLALIILVSSTIVIIGRNAAPRTTGARLAAGVTLIAVCAGVFGGFTNAITI